MLLVGLTGGIGSGKTTVAGGLSTRGAAVVDADGIARQVMSPGGRAHDAVVERFGPDVLAADGTIDRPTLAAVVFNDDAARRDLDAITHPAIGSAMAERVAELVAAEARIVVLDVPLLNSTTVRSYGLGAVVVVDTPVEIAVERLVGHRGFDIADARARVKVQMSREERRELTELGPPGLVIDNSGDQAALDSEIGRAWTWLASLAA